MSPDLQWTDYSFDTSPLYSSHLKCQIYSNTAASSFAQNHNMPLNKKKKSIVCSCFVVCWIFPWPLSLSQSEKQPVGAIHVLCIDAERVAQWTGSHIHNSALQPSNSDRHGTSKRQTFTKSLSTTTNKTCQTQTLETVSQPWYL